MSLKFLGVLENVEELWMSVFVSRLEYWRVENCWEELLGSMEEKFFTSQIRRDYRLIICVYNISVLEQ